MYYTLKGAIKSNAYVHCVIQSDATFFAMSLVIISAITSFNSSIVSSLALQNIRCIHTNLDSDSDTIKEEFSTFLMDLVGIIQDKQEKEETGIVGGAK